MLSNSREEIQEDFDALRAAVSRMLGHSYDALTNPERLALLERLEQETRRLRVPGHELINQLAEQSDSTELGGKLSHVLADRLRITRAEAGRRVAEAADLGPRRALTGEPLPPLLTATAAALRAGKIGAGHVAGDPAVLRPAAAFGGRRHPGMRREAFGQAGHPVSPRSGRQAGRPARRLSQPRRQIHRRGSCPPPRTDPGQTRQ